MKKFAFVGKNDGILRITKNEGTAKKKAKNGKYIETELECDNSGYPLWEIKEDGKSGKNGIIVYGPDEMKYEAKGKEIEPIYTLAELYKSLA